MANLTDDEPLYFKADEVLAISFKGGSARANTVAKRLNQFADISRLLNEKAGLPKKAMLGMEVIQAGRRKPFKHTTIAYIAVKEGDVLLSVRRIDDSFWSSVSEAAY